MRTPLMQAIRELDVVRVTSLDSMRCGLEDRYARAPEIGDVATVVMALRAPKHPDGYLCECVAADGTTRWLATFPREALAPIESTP